MTTPSERPQTFVLRFPDFAEEQRPAPGGALGALTRLCDRLEALADLAERIGAGASGGAGEEEVRGLVDRSRLARSRLQDAQRAMKGAEVPRTAEALASMQRLRAATARCQTGENAILAWLDRPPPDPVLVATGTDGAATALVDRLLLSAWDTDADVVLLLGADTAAVADDLFRRRQRRVIALLRDEEDDSTFPPAAFVVRSADELADTLQGFTDPRPRNLVARQLGEWRLDDAARAELVTDVLDGLEQKLAIQNTARKFGRLWTEQGMANLRHIARWPSVAALRGPLAGMPMVIVAPGPSLSRNVDLLRRLEGRAVICTFSRTLKALAAAGVTPDLVLVLDPLDLRYHFEGVPVDGIEALVLGLSVHPGLYEMPVKRVFTFSGNSLIERWIADAFDEHLEVPTSASVATSAFSLARAWGCDPVILVGQDLAFPDGQIYAAGAADGGARLERDGESGEVRVEGLGEEIRRLEDQGQAALSASYRRLREVPGYHGGSVSTTRSFAWVRSWFEEKARAWGDGMRLINATEGGARIGGMEQLPLSEAADLCTEERDVPRALDQAMASIDPPDRARRLLLQVDGVIAALQRSGRLARQCRELAGRRGLGRKQLKKLGRLEAELIQAMQPTRVFIALFGQRAIDGALERARQATTLDQSLAASRELYEVVLDAHRSGLPALREAQQAIHGELL